MVRVTTTRYSPYLSIIPMKHQFYRRLLEVEILTLFIPSQLLITYFLRTYADQTTISALFKILVIGVCIAFLVNARMFNLLQSRFSALQPYVIRLLLIACLLFTFPAWDLSPASGPMYIAAVSGVVIAVLLISVAQFCAILGV